MLRASPVELRKALVVTDSFKKAGIGFVPIPYTNEQEREELTNLLIQRMDAIDSSVPS